MQNKTLRSVLIVFVSIVLVVCVFGSGFVVGNFVPALKPASVPTLSSTPGNNQGGTPADLQSQFAPFWQAWDLVHQYYVDKSQLDDTILMQGAVRGMMDAIGDKFSGYWDPSETADANNTMQGEYDGIGAWVDISGDYLTITEPMTGSPAEQAGLLTGDQIIAVDGVDVTGMKPELVRKLKVLGPAGTSIHLTVLRQGQEQPLEFDITRAHIVVPSVTSRMLDDNIAYIKIILFGDNTANDFKEQLGTLMAQNPHAIILDLRNNGGGYVSAAITVASQFISNGVIFYEETADGTRTPNNAEPDGLATGSLPMVVLVNQFSASASEIVSGALQDTGRAKLLGVKTYGKGSEQNWIPLSDGSTARITIAKWLTPNGTSIHGTGLTPDITVEMTTEDYQAGRDPQLDAAVQYLLNPQP
jgi:carboxyl-terminal processing protease